MVVINAEEERIADLCTKVKKVKISEPDLTPKFKTALLAWRPPPSQVTADSTATVLVIRPPLMRQKPRARQLVHVVARLATMQLASRRLVLFRLATNPPSHIHQVNTLTSRTTVSSCQ